MTDSSNNKLPRVLAIGSAFSPELSNRDSFGPLPLKQICKLFGLKAGVYAASDLDEFRLAARFIGKAAQLPEVEGGSLLVHIIAEGGKAGMEIGPDTISWDRLNEIVVDILRDLETYPGHSILAFMTRGATGRELGEFLLKLGDSEIRVPEHLFLFLDNSPSELDKTLAWTHFYGALTTLDCNGDSGTCMPDTDSLRSRLEQLGMISL